ncbi:MAG TPA: SoxR reducing system RseC family protein [Candidatus Limiplasma sp.]|nr:SoxR reducing system RseC family protein [Candidatus Limiplasma sp.]
MIKFGHIIERNEEKGLVTVRFERPEACGKCNACGTGTQKGEITLPSDCQVGQWVRVELPEGRFLQATALVYIVPLTGLLLGLFAGLILGAGNDLWTVIGAVVGLLLSLLVLHTVDKHVSKKPEWTPKITATYTDNPTINDIGCGLS